MQTVYKGSWHQPKDKLSPAEAACLTCPHPDCIWHYGRHRNYCPIQRERMAKAKEQRA